MLKNPKVFKMTKMLTFLGGGRLGRDLGGGASGSSKPYRQHDSAPEGQNHAAGTIEPPLPVWEMQSIHLSSTRDLIAITPLTR